MGNRQKPLTFRINDNAYEQLLVIREETGIPIHSLVLMAICWKVGIFEDSPQSQ